MSAVAILPRNLLRREYRSRKYGIIGYALTRKGAATERERLFASPSHQLEEILGRSSARPGTRDSVTVRSQRQPIHGTTWLSPNARVQACPRLAWRLLRRRHDRRGHCL